MKWKEFDQKYQVVDCLDKLIYKYVSEFLDANKDLEIIGFGADCNACYFNCFISVLTKDAEGDIPEWKENWQWIAEWNYWDLNEGFDNEESYQVFKDAFDEFSSDEASDSNDIKLIKEGFMKAVCDQLKSTHSQFNLLKDSKLVIRDHGDLQEESEKRL